MGDYDFYSFLVLPIEQEGRISRGAMARTSLLDTEMRRSHRLLNTQNQSSSGELLPSGIPDCVVLLDMHISRTDEELARATSAENIQRVTNSFIHDHVMSPKYRAAQIRMQQFDRKNIVFAAEMKTALAAQARRISAFEERRAMEINERVSAAARRIHATNIMSQIYHPTQSRITAEELIAMMDTSSSDAVTEGERGRIRAEVRVSMGAYPELYGPTMPVYSAGHTNTRDQSIVDEFHTLTTPVVRPARSTLYAESYPPGHSLSGCSSPTSRDDGGFEFPDRASLVYGWIFDVGTTLRARPRVISGLYCS